MLDYENAADTAPSSSRKPFLEGDIDAKMLITKAVNTMGYTGNKYVIELRVLEAAPTEAGKPCPAVGAERVVIIDLDNEKYGAPNLMAFANGLNGGPMTGATKEERGAKLRKLLGVREIDATEAQKRGIAPVKAQEAFAIGMVVGNRTNGGKTKAGEPFTYHNWYSLNQTIAQREQRRAALAAGQPVTLDAGNTAA